MKPIRKRQASGFTLIELMVTVAIIGVLAATATTLFQDQQLRSKRAEAMSNLEAVAKMARGYFGEVGAYPAVAGTWPAPVPSPDPKAWDTLSSTAFGVVGFRAEGAVRYRYDLDGGGECPCASGACFSVLAYSDLEGDSKIGGVGYFHRDGAAVECPATLFGWLAPLDKNGNPIYDAPAAYMPVGGIPLAADDY